MATSINITNAPTAAKNFRLDMWTPFSGRVTSFRQILIDPPGEKMNQEVKARKNPPGRTIEPTRQALAIGGAQDRGSHGFGEG